MAGQTSGFPGGGVLGGTPVSPGSPSGINIDLSELGTSAALDNVIKGDGASGWVQGPVPGGGVPALHAASHQNGGLDEVGTATPGANAIPKANASNKLASGWGGSANTLATLDGSGTIPDSEIPAGITRDSELTTHAGVAAAHHAKYTDGEADVRVTAGIATHAGAADPHTVYQKESEKGNANGYASLDGAGTIPDTEIPSGIARDSEITSAISTHAGVAAAHHTNANDPVVGEKAALPGTSGTPGVANKYVTDADSRNSDARTPIMHTNSHKHGGGDEVGTATPGANEIPKAGVGGTLAAGWLPAGVPVWQKVTKTYSDLATAGTTNDIELLSLLAGGVIHAVKIKHSASFTNGAITAYTVSVGIVGTLAKYHSAFDVFQAPGNTVQSVESNVDIENHGAATSIRLAAISTGANLDQAVAGSVDVWVLISTAV